MEGARFQPFDSAADRGAHRVRPLDDERSAIVATHLDRIEAHARAEGRRRHLNPEDAVSAAMIEAIRAASAPGITMANYLGYACRRIDKAIRREANSFTATGEGDPGDGHPSYHPSISDLAAWVADSPSPPTAFASDADEAAARSAIRDRCGPMNERYFMAFWELVVKGRAIKDIASEVGASRSLVFQWRHCAIIEIRLNLGLVRLRPPKSPGRPRKDGSRGPIKGEDAGRRVTKLVTIQPSHLPARRST